MRRVWLVLVLLAGLAAPAVAPADAQGDGPTDPDATSVWPCPHWGMYGRVVERTFATDCPTGLSPQTAPTLTHQWFHKTERTVTASPTVVEGVVYVGDWSPAMHALDAATGDLLWRTETEGNDFVPFGPIVSSAAVADVDVDGRTRRLVIFGSAHLLYALDAEDGSEVWRLDVSGPELVEGEQTEIEASPLVRGGIVYVGMDTHNQTTEETGGERSALLAVDAATGTELWRFEPDHLDQSGCGSIWASPTLNLEDGLIYIATGNCPQDDYEWGPYIEAVVALDLATGAPVWSFQPHEPNRDDVDFGATPNLFTDADGRRILGVGNKDAHYYALDPVTGELLWETQVAEPGNVREDFAIGGFIGSSAVGEGMVFGTTALGGPPYFHALDAATGELAWQGPQGPSYAASAYANGVVLSGALDSLLHVYDAATGLPLNVIPLAGPVSSGPAIVGNQVFVGSGTSSSDACAKELPAAEVCEEFFRTVLGGLGGVHALQVLAGGPGEPSPSPSPSPDSSPTASPSPSPDGPPPSATPSPARTSFAGGSSTPSTPGTGGGALLVGLAIGALLAAGLTGARGARRR